MEHREMSYRQIYHDSSTSLDRRNAYNGSQLSRLTSTTVYPGVNSTSNAGFSPRSGGVNDRSHTYDDPPRSYMESKSATDPGSEYFGSTPRKNGSRETRDLPVAKKREPLTSGSNKSSEKIRSPSQIDVEYHRLSSARSPIGNSGDNLGEVTMGPQVESKTFRRTKITRNDISVVVDDGRDYVKCKKEVDGRAIWRYIRDTSQDISPDDHKLLMFCIAELAKINKYRITSNMELRVYSSSINGISPIFYSGRRGVKCVAIWHDYKDPEFIQINKSICSYVPKYCLLFLSVLLLVCAIFTYLWFAVTKWHEFFIEMAHSFNATVNVVGNSNSNLNFDDLDININMAANANNGKK